MSFSFDFALSIGDEPKNDERPPLSTPVDVGVTEKPRDHLVPFRWITNLQELLEQRRLDQIIYDEVNIIDGVDIHVASSEEGQNNADNSLRRVDLTRSSFSNSASRDEILESSNDLVPGVYEGGLKVWESSVDLVRYMHDDKESALPWMVSGAVETGNAATPIRCLELGCGHGLPSCYILQQAARKGMLENIEVFATDYNDYVLKDALMSNIVLNMAELDINSDNLARSIKMGSGDWFGLLHDDTNGIGSNMHKFDWIAATETLYTVEAAQETALLISRLLRPETGQAWVASKRYYFGVGGGVDAFREAASAVAVPVDGISYKLEVEVVRVYDSGKANIRELLRVWLKKT